jgi:hypothetical protein
MGILSVTDDNKGLTVLLVNNYAGQPAGEVQQAEGQLSLQLHDQQAAVQQLVPICQQLARLSAKSQQLLGADQAQQAQVRVPALVSTAAVLAAAWVAAFARGTHTKLVCICTGFGADTCVDPFCFL